MILSQKALEGSGCDVGGSAACGAPLHINADGNPPEHAQHPDTRIALHPAAVIVVGDIQALVQTVFNAPPLAIELEPQAWTQPLGRGTGDQGHFFVLSSGALAHQARHLGGQGKADVLCVRQGGANGAVFIPAFILVLRSGFGVAGLPEGGNPLGER